MNKIRLFNVILAVFLAVLFRELNAQAWNVPGVVINHIAASTETYIASPSICILPNGDYIASHDYFGPGSTEYSRALTAVFKSSDKGLTWQKISEINGQFWSNLFVHKGLLYIIGTWKHNGNFIIRRSSDGGTTWTSPRDNKTGILIEGEYHTAPMPLVIHNGRLWRAIEKAVMYNKNMDTHLCPMVISIPVDADLLIASNWKLSNYLPFNGDYLDGKFINWLEGNAVVTPEDKMVNILRVATSEKGKELAAVVNISEDGSSVSFDPSTGFIDFTGGATKFSIRYDEKSDLYWSITNMVDKEFSYLDASMVRNKLVLKSSKDLKNWVINRVLLYHPDVKKHGFHYIDWQIENNDIVFVSNTAYDDDEGGANSYHDTNYVTFHRIINFRSPENK